jgi:hypothetical protein
MEDVLDLYAAPYAATEPVVCLDERPVQLLSDVREPLPAKPGDKRRFDYEYHRKGTCNLFMLLQPRKGWRTVQVTSQRTKQDFAHCLWDLVDVHFPDAKQIHVVLDNLNTHTFGALYEMFPPAEAQRIMRQLDFHFTPKHGSWLNMVEIELFILSRQCPKQHIPNQACLRSEVAAWTERRNAEKAMIQWCFTVTDARTKLARLYPS